MTNCSLRNLLRHAMCALCLGLGALTLVPASDACAQETSQDFITKGNGLYNTKKYDEAVLSYVKAIQIDPKTALKAYLNCARAYSMLKDYVNSKRFYDYYFEVSGINNDKKINAEYKAVVRKIKKDESYVRPEAQARVLVQLQSTMMSGPYVNRQGGGAFAYYDILLRTGFAEPMLDSLQNDLIKGLLIEVENEIRPVEGQPLPNLDRVGWEYVRNKLARATLFPSVVPDLERVARLENTALGWEAYLRSEYSVAAQYFDKACDEQQPLPAAFWGRMMAAFHTDSDDAILKRIELTDKVYQDAALGKFDAYFALLRAQVYRSQGKYDDAIKELTKMGDAL